MKMRRLLILGFWIGFCRPNLQNYEKVYPYPPNYDKVYPNLQNYNKVYPPNMFRVPRSVDLKGMDERIKPKLVLAKIEMEEKLVLNQTEKIHIDNRALMDLLLRRNGLD